MEPARKEIREQFEESCPQDYVDKSGTVAVLTSGLHEFDWDPEQWIWMPSDVALGLEEAHMVQLIQVDNKYSVDVNGTAVFIYRTQV